MEQAIKLKSCPFCGSNDVIVERYGDHLTSTIYTCENCGCKLETGEEWGHGRRWNERNIQLTEVEILDIVNKLDKNLDIKYILLCIKLILDTLNGEVK